jgi:hypothetical protein
VKEAAFVRDAAAPGGRHGRCTVQRRTLNRQHKGDAGTMKEIADSFVKLLALIMTMITLAVSTAAFSMMFG